MSKDNIGEFEMSIPGMKRSFVNGRHGRTTVVNLDAVKSLAKQADARIAELEKEVERLERHVSYYARKTGETLID